VDDPISGLPCSHEEQPSTRDRIEAGADLERVGVLVPREGRQADCVDKLVGPITKHGKKVRHFAV
jgi:hypothetical protein